jgi:hypothetical protein
MTASLLTLMGLGIAATVFIVSIHHNVAIKGSKKSTINPTQNSSEQNSTSSRLGYIFVIVEENQPYNNIVNNPQAPYINSLIAKYALATNYSAVSHPSLPNYLALTSGSTDGIATDCNPPNAGCEVSVPNIADEIEASGRSWKEYAESMPSNCYAYNSGEYATKHNPFVYYSDIINNQPRCDSHVVPFTNLINDLSSINSTPNYAFITPNLCDDMHDCSIATGDAWLAKYVPFILQSKAFSSKPSLLIITWDEGNSTDNHVAAIFTGSAAKNGYRSNNPFNHYSLLHTIEVEWGLSPLTSNDKQAPTMTSFLNTNK